MATGGEAARIMVRVSPRASSSKVAGVREGAVLVRVTAPPVEGKANKAVCEVIAKEVGVPKSRVAVIQGATGRDKLVEITGISQESAEAKLGIGAQPELF
jgi:uncharacterized protein (TIGR00251 family)